MNAADDAKLTAIPGFPWPNPVSCIKEAVCPELCGSRAPVKAQPTKAEDCRVCFVDVAKGPSMLESRRGFSAFNVAEAVQRRREVR